MICGNFQETTFFCMLQDFLITEFETKIENGLSSSEVLRRQYLHGLN
jgi:hypothetical protein